MSKWTVYSIGLGRHTIIIAAQSKGRAVWAAGA